VSSIKIIPEKTAISHGVAKSAWLIAEEIPTGSHVLDYGAGRLRNTHFLLQKGYDVSILETRLQLENLAHQDLSKLQDVYCVDDNITRQFQVILCSFVLNVIPEPVVRSHILKRCHDLLNLSGKLFVEVRKKREILNNKHKLEHGDGYVIGNREIKTFQKPFEKEEFRDYISAHGFMVERIQSSSEGWSIVARKDV
jgi:hypothetical protein